MERLAAIAVTAPLALAGAAIVATSIEASTFPSQIIRKAEAAHEWPFSLDEGELTCVAMQGQRFVFFSEILTDEEMGTFGNMKLPRSVVVSTNPFSYLATIENRDLYAPFDSLETLIRRLAPYEVMGRALCAQDRKPKAPLRTRCC